MDRTLGSSMPLPELTAVKKCPFCAEEIQDEARVCKHCGRDLVQGASQSARFETRTPLGTARDIVQLVAPKKRTSAVTWLATIVFGLVFLGWCSSSFNPRPSGPATPQGAGGAPSSATAPTPPPQPR